MDHYHHLTIEQRENLLVCVNQGKKYAEIAAEIHCSESTVSREIRRNSACGTMQSSVCGVSQEAYSRTLRRNKYASPAVSSTVRTEPLRQSGSRLTPERTKSSRSQVWEKLFK